MSYQLRPLTAEQGQAMAMWSYPGPWAVYDVTGAIDPQEGAVVQDWNQRSRRLLAGLGFEETGNHHVGETRYVVYERSADGEQA